MRHHGFATTGGNGKWEIISRDIERRTGKDSNIPCSISKRRNNRVVRKIRCK